MQLHEKALKFSKLLRRRKFFGTLLRHRVSAAVEHLDAIRFCSPATLIDVGANKGQFAMAVRGLFPNAVIYAFEPLPKPASRFEKVFGSDPITHLHRIAIGGAKDNRTFYVTDREDSSSLLKPGNGQLEAFGISAKEEIEVVVKPLDSVIRLESVPRPILLKIDVQGSELDVLKGIAVLEAVDFIYVELSFVELYEGQALFEDAHAYMTARGFTLRGMFNQAYTEAFGPTQADCLFVRKGHYVMAGPPAAA